MGLYLKDQNKVYEVCKVRYNHKMNTKKVTITMPVDVIEKAKKAAEEQGRSFSNMVAHLVAEGTKSKAA